MFSRSRKKIILAIMVSLLLLFAVTLSVIVLASYHEMRQRSSEMLERYTELYSRDQQPGPEMVPDGKPGDQEFPGSSLPMGDLPPDLGPGFQLSTFYSVAFLEDGTVLSVNDGAKGLYSEDELITIARDLLTKGKTAGRLDNLSYRIRSKPGYTLVAFIDDTVMEGSMRTLLHNVLIIGGVSMMILFLIALVLSGRIIRPLEENDNRQKQFISDASHELKTPVAVIGTNAELLSRELGENEWLANIQYENERMGDLVKQLLDLSRAENAKTPMETVNLTRIVTGEVLAFESVAYDQGKTIRSDMEEELHVLGNQAQLAQLTSILLDNAVRHGTGSEVELSLKRQGRMAVLNVVNDGDEIPPEKQEHLFDRFYRVDEARSSDGHHYGLGLSIAKAVTEKHGGNITVSSQDGKVRLAVSIPEKKE